MTPTDAAREALDAAATTGIGYIEARDAFAAVVRAEVAPPQGWQGWWHTDGDSCTGIRCGNPEHGYESAETLAAHEPGCDTDSNYDFGSMWLTCSCGWTQQGKHAEEDWSVHVRALAATPAMHRTVTGDYDIVWEPAEGDATPSEDPGLHDIEGHSCPQCRRVASRRARAATPAEDEEGRT